MKRAKVFYTVAIGGMIVCLCALCAGCFGSIEGTYKLKSITVDGQTYEVGEQLNGVTVSEDDFVIELTGDGDIVVNDTVVGEWDKTGLNDIELYLSGEIMTGKISGNTLTVINGDTKTVLRKEE